jgi:hypothetical protein
VLSGTNFCTGLNRTNSGRDDFVSPLRRSAFPFFRPKIPIVAG